MRYRLGMVASCFLGIGACSGGGDGDPPTGPTASLVLEARTLQLQTGQTGAPVSQPPSVRATRAGKPVAGVTVTFAITAGDGRLEGGTTATDANGVASASSWKLGRIGRNLVTATATGSATAPLVFEAIADGGPSTEARFSFADSVNVGSAAVPQWVPAGIRGDGRGRDGQPATAPLLGGEYQGQFCGVQAVIGRGAAYQENDSFTFYPSRYWTDNLPAGCQPARAFRFYLDGAAAAPRLLHPLSIAADLGLLAVGQSTTQTQVYQTGAAEVGGIRFIDDPVVGTSAVLITRLPDLRDELDRPVRQWRVESRGTHKAQYLSTGTAVYLPFSLTVTEVPFPFPTFP